jgi:hypothetical protein
VIRKATSLLSQHDGPLFFVGIDWAAAEHAVCVRDHTGGKIAAFTIAHTAAGFATLACNKRLRLAITTFAANSRFSSSWAADICDRVRASGRTHQSADRSLILIWRLTRGVSCLFLFRPRGSGISIARPKLAPERDGGMTHRSLRDELEGGWVN